MATNDNYVQVGNFEKIQEEVKNCMQVHQRSELKLCMNGEHSSFFNFFF